MKRFAVLLLTLALAVCCTLPAFAADTIEVNEDVSVSGDYDWTRFKGQNITLNVYNWGEYISNGSDDSLDVVSAFEDLTGIKVNYTTFDSNESMYAKLKSGAADYDVVIPSDYMVAKMIAEGLLKPLNYDNIPTSRRSTRNTATRITTPRTPIRCPTCCAPPASSTTPRWWTRHPPAGQTCGMNSMPATS